MLFTIDPNTPKFEVFTQLNNELMLFTQNSIDSEEFCRELFSEGQIGQACWDNTKANNRSAKNDLTREKFENLFLEIKKLERASRERLYDNIFSNQNLEEFFNTPNLGLLDGFTDDLQKKLQNLAYHLYTSTKDLSAIVNACNGKNIKDHFHTFVDYNGIVCKVCGLEKISILRNNISNSQQWRADYDHQLCKSKYPFFAVHPDNLIPICDVCNQDAKGDKDLFRKKNSQARKAFYPYSESSNQYLELNYENAKDPEPIFKLCYNTQDPLINDKLATWDDVYEIKNRVERIYHNFSEKIVDDITPDDFADFNQQLLKKTNSGNSDTFKRKPQYFWDCLFYRKLNELNDTDKEALWKKIEFYSTRGESGAEYILDGFFILPNQHVNLEVVEAQLEWNIPSTNEAEQLEEFGI